MKILIISDTHFGHKLIKEEMGEDFEELIIKRWNERVRPIDTVIHLGDFSLGKFKDYSLSDSVLMWRNQLNGTLVLVRGNHDNESDSWYMKHGFTFSATTIDFKHMGKRILFSHEPREFGDFDINIHGHLHGNIHRLTGDLSEYPWKNPGRYIDISDFSKYREPINLDDLL